jgi:hypothetical protein
VDVYAANSAPWPSLSYYPGSGSVQNGTDLAFRTWVTAPPACLEAVFYARIQAPTDYALTNIPEAYCSNEMSEVTPKHEVDVNEEWTFTLDGEMVDAFVPGNLSEGVHEAGLFVHREGCIDSIYSVFEIVPPVELSIENLEEVYCSVSGPVEIVGSPAGGIFTINGEEGSVLDPSALGVGIHTVNYSYNTPLDEVHTRDQWCCGSEAYSYGSLYALNDGEGFTQSFTASMTGRLDSIILSFSQMGQEFTYDVKIYEGEGMSGTVLDETVLAPGPFENTIDITGDMDPVLMAGEVYTFSVLRIAGPVEFVPYIQYYSSDQYAAGAGSLPIDIECDLLFTEYITAEYGCEGIVSEDFTVEICTGVNELSVAGIGVYPNPFKGSFVLESPEGIRYELFDITGKRLESGSLPNGGKVRLGERLESAGIYFLRCWVMGTGVAYTGKVVLVD